MITCTVFVPVGTIVSLKDEYCSGNLIESGNMFKYYDIERQKQRLRWISSSKLTYYLWISEKIVDNSRKKDLLLRKNKKKQEK